MTEVTTVAELREQQLRSQQEQQQKKLEEQKDEDEDEEEEDEEEDEDDEDEDDNEEEDEDDGKIIKDDITKYRMTERPYGVQLKKVKQNSNPQTQTESQPQPQNPNQPQTPATAQPEDDDDDDDSVDSDVYAENDRGILWIGHTYGVNHTYIPPMMNTYGMEKPVDEDAEDTDTFRRWFLNAVGFISYWTGMGRRDKKKTNPAPSSQNGETDANNPQVAAEKQ